MEITFIFTIYYSFDIMAVYIVNYFRAIIFENSIAYVFHSILGFLIYQFPTGKDLVVLNSPYPFENKL